MEIKQTEDQSFTLYNPHYDEFYHCKGGALAKAKHIFLAPLLESITTNPPKPYCVLEVGFGTGLNYFVTADAFYDCHLPLEYWALDKQLLSSDTLASLKYEKHLKQPTLAHQFILDRARLPIAPSEGEYDFQHEHNIHLKILLAEARNVSLQENLFDWIYLDAFSPRTNPELWTHDFLQKLYQSLKPGGGLTSYCVKGEIRRILKSVGFVVHKRPGILYKREVLLAIKPDQLVTLDP